MDPFVQKLHDRPINRRYTLVDKLGRGGFGAVYLEARDLINGEEVALKLEHRSVDPSFLEAEARRYKCFEGVVGFPRVYWFGEHDDFKVMAFELLGPSLEDLFTYCGNRFSLKTTLMIADQVLVRLQEMHQRGVIHRDIKPQNFLAGCGTSGNVIHVTDFGLAEEVKLPCAVLEEKALVRSRLVGTARFASIRGHQGRVQSPRDDLESLGYMMIYFLRGSLPWQGLRSQGKGEKARSVMEKKIETSVEELCEGLPEVFSDYMEVITTLRDGERPDYANLRHPLQRLAREQRWEYDHVFDWTIRVYLEAE